MEPMDMTIDEAMRFIRTRTPVEATRRKIGEFITAVLDEHEHDIEADGILGIQLFDLTTMRSDTVKSGLYMMRVHVSKASDPLNLAYHANRWVYMLINQDGEISTVNTLQDVAYKWTIPDPQMR